MKHPHADLMMQYAQDAAETPYPWTQWQFRDTPQSDWESMLSSPSWADTFQYRRKPLTAILELPQQTLALTAGERYAGTILNADASVAHHLILLPGQASDIRWSDANAWVTNQGGELPTRHEQALLYANLKDEFEERWYWSDEQYAAYADYAWCQYFGDGYQSYYHKGSKLRACAVRRVCP